MRGLDVHYVVRLGPRWHVRQFLLFRDLEDPDLWLATDGAGTWGEMNGAVRDDLAGCTDASLVGAPFRHTPVVRRLVLDGDDEGDVLVAEVDAETLQVEPVGYHYRRVGERRWSVEGPAGVVEVSVDEHGLALDEPGGHWRL